MWIALGILLFLVALISAILFLPIHILLKRDEKEDIRLFVRVLFVKVDILKLIEKNKNKPKKKKKPSAFKKWLKKVFDHKPKEKTSKQKGIFEKVSETLSAVKLVITALKEFLKKITIKKLRIYVVTADTEAADAALDYGKLCAVVYPAVGFLQTAVTVKQKGLDVDIRCDFDADEPEFYIHTDIVFNLFDVITVFLHAAMQKK